MNVCRTEKNIRAGFFTFFKDSFCERLPLKISIINEDAWLLYVVIVVLISGHEIRDDLVQSLVAILAQVSVLGDLVQEWFLSGLDVFQKLLLEVCDL